jgi:poly(beta-D-mannuronate) lyase
MKIKSLSLLFFMLICLSISAKTYTISKEEELQNLSSKLQPADLVLIKDGNYSNWKIEINSKGLKDKPIIIRAEHPGKVIFSGSTTNTVFTLSGEYIQLSGITFKSCTLEKQDKMTGLLIELKNTVSSRVNDCTFEKNVVKGQFMPLVIVSGSGTYNQVDHCTFTANVDNQDVQVKITATAVPLYTTISYNHFSNKSKVSWKNGNGGECIQIGQDPVLLGNQAPKTIVTENSFQACNAENEVISNKSSGNTYSHNHFINNDGELVMRGGHDCIISDNVFEGGTGGIRINGTGHQIINNKISDIKTAIRLMYGMANGKTDTGFYIAASNCKITGNQISNAETGILIGDSKDVDWTGKFDTKKYPSQVFQNVAPSNNQVSGNTFTKVRTNTVEK